MVDITDRDDLAEPGPLVSVASTISVADTAESMDDLLSRRRHRTRPPEAMVAKQERPGRKTYRDPARGDVTLAAERERVDREARGPHGTHCQACGTRVQEMPRTIHASMASALIVLWRAGGTHWQDKTTLFKRIPVSPGRDEQLLRFWGLMELADSTRFDGGATGWCRVTEKGEAFVLGHVMVPEYAVSEGGSLIELAGHDITIHDTLGHAFNYRELMNASIDEIEASFKRREAEKDAKKAGKADSPA